MSHTTPIPSRDWKEFWFVAVSQVFLGLFLLIFTSFLLLILVIGIPRIDWDFVLGLQSRFPHQAGMLSAVAGTFELMILVVILALPAGILSAIFLQEFGANSGSRTIRRITRFFDILLSGMESVPSVVYGLLGLAFFAGLMSLGRSLATAALTLAAMAVPPIINSCRRALNSVPRETRDVSFALGASRWQVVSLNILPQAFPEIVAGSCMALARTAGEAAPLLVIGAASHMTFIPDSLLSPFAALPVEIYNWTVQAGAGMPSNSAAAILLLLPFLLGFNIITVLGRRYWRKRSEGSGNEQFR